MSKLLEIALIRDRKLPGNSTSYSASVVGNCTLNEVLDKSTEYFASRLDGVKNIAMVRA